MSAAALTRLRGDDTTRWRSIFGAQSLGQTKSDELSELVRDLLPTDEGCLIIFGSLARREYTTGSDLDWAIIIDGRVDSSHWGIVHKVRAKLKSAGFRDPGTTGVFGGLVMSHDLVHQIGGDEDTNKNTTRRLLLLLESEAIGSSLSIQVRQRVISAVLDRYVLEDASFIRANTRDDKIPRFLLNDVIRYWRTMAVDYANKYRSRGGEKSALRNIKLRMSRKLIFVSGLLMCVSWALRDRAGEEEEEKEGLIAHKLVGYLRDWTNRPSVGVSCPSCGAAWAIVG